MKQDNFELIAQDAVKTITAVILTLKLIGDDKYQSLAESLAEDAEDLCIRAIALHS
jgi:hypothetical protein